jgi:hypothetical protein
MKTLIATLLFIPAFACAAEWTEADSVRESTYLALHLIDWGQTRNIVHRESEDYYEKVNPILGRHPSIGRVNTYMTVSAVTHVGIAYFLPRQWRDVFQYTTMGYKAGLVIGNDRIGLRVDF